METHTQGHHRHYHHHRYKQQPVNSCRKKLNSRAVFGELHLFTYLGLWVFVRLRLCVHPPHTVWMFPNARVQIKTITSKHWQNALALVVISDHNSFSSVFMIAPAPHGLSMGNNSFDWPAKHHPPQPTPGHQTWLGCYPVCRLASVITNEGAIIWYMSRVTLAFMFK